MNKAITDGAYLKPPAFGKGLDVWSSGNGTPGSNSYQDTTNAVLIPADRDFGGCLEMQKTESVQKLRYMGETPLLPGCYLRIRARIKAISGNLPSVRIAGWAGGAGGHHIGGLIETGPSVALKRHGEIVEVAAIVGPGARLGVDMAWGNTALYGHFGLDLTGANGGILRIDDLDIEDMTGAFLRDLINLVDIRDFGAIGDGRTDCTAAFKVADDAAAGRAILVPAGVYHLADNLSVESPVNFEGRITMPEDKAIVLARNFDLPGYIAAFGSEELAFTKAFQALMRSPDHDALDMGGRRVTLSRPIDMRSTLPAETGHSTRRIIRNGQFIASGSAGWKTRAVTARATYAIEASHKLSDVANIAEIAVGSLVQGKGVGREIYVRARDVGARELVLSAPLYGAEGTQGFTFTDFKYLMDFSGFDELSQFSLQDVTFQCRGRSSAIRLAPGGNGFQLRDCNFDRPRDRCVSSIGTGCQGIVIKGCRFLSSEQALNVPDRTSIAVNVNAGDATLRRNRASGFRHFALVGGTDSVILGNHLLQGDALPLGTRSAGLIVARRDANATVSGNRIDNCTIEWTNERDPAPEFRGGCSFGAMSITDNIMRCGDVAPGFSFIVIKPYGSGHFLNGVTVSGNRFRSENGMIDRVERVDSSLAGLDFGRTGHLRFADNSFHAIRRQVSNPLRLRHCETSEVRDWLIDADGELPFGGWLRGVDSIIPVGWIEGAGSNVGFSTPFAVTEQGARRDALRLVWNRPARGQVALLVRMDL